MKFICPLTPSGIGFYLLSLLETKVNTLAMDVNRVNTSNSEENIQATKQDSISNQEKRVISEQEELIIFYLSKGLSQKEIGEELNLSPKTVNNHITNIHNKLGINKTSELLGYYICLLKGKPFNLALMRKYGVAIFLILLNVCKLNELPS